MTYSADYRAAALRAIDEHIGFLDEAVRLACARFYLARSTIYTWLALLRDTGSYTPRRKRGPKNEASYVIPQEQVDYLLNHIDTVDAQIYEDEMADLLATQFDMYYTQQQISAVLVKNKYTNKKISRIAEEQNDEERRDFRQLITGIEANCWIWADESHLSGKNARRSRGRALKGRQAFRRMPGVRGVSDMASSVCALTLDGIILATTYENIVEGETFLTWFEFNLLPLCGNYPAPRSVIGLDNASVHMKARLLQLIALSPTPNVLLFFLPPYSYDMNPIEMCFHLGKSLLVRDNHQHEGDVVLATQFEAAMMSCCSPEVACNLFEKCGIKVEAWERVWANR